MRQTHPTLSGGVAADSAVVVAVAGGGGGVGAAAAESLLECGHLEEEEDHPIVATAALEGDRLEV